MSIVTICMPSYNRSDLIGETLESVLSQTSPDWELMIVDDGSADKTVEVVQAFLTRDQRIHFLKRDREPKGAGTCRNIGVDRGSGDYLLFLDTDDLLEPFCIEQRLNAMHSNPELDFAIFPSLLFHEKRGDLNLWWNIDKPERDELSRQFHLDAICQGTGALFKKESFNRIGRWDENLAIWQDIDLFLRAYIRHLKYKKFFDLPPDLHIRRLETSLSRSDYFGRRKLESQARILKRTANDLKRYSRMSYLRELRYMASQVITGSARSGNLDLARDLVRWASVEAVFSAEETVRHRFYCIGCRFKLMRISLIRKWLEGLVHYREVEVSVGRFPYISN